MTILVLLLILAITLYVAVGRRTANEREALGLQHGSIVVADDARIGSPTLRSKRLRLAGRPDHVLRSGGVFSPIEQKPHSTRLQPSHALQIAAQCLLVQEIYRVRPPYAFDKPVWPTSMLRYGPPIRGLSMFTSAGRRLGLGAGRRSSLL